jgi:Fe-S cluster biogenesis protein NfuA
LEYSVCHIGVEFTKETLRHRVAKALEELKPKMQADGGDIELLGLENGVVKVRMKGACAGCPMSAMTLKMGVEQYLKKRVPEIVRVDAL